MPTYAALVLVVPRYGTASLADVMPALLAALRVPGEDDRIGLDLTGVRRICLLLVDGLGAQALAKHPDTAPFLSALAGPTLTAGFPSTTAASLSSLGTGRPPGEHGIVGYLLAVPGHDRVMNVLQWRLHGPGPAVDLLSDVVPEHFQPAPTAFERAEADGVRVSRIGPAFQERSGLTRAALRGGQFRASHSAGDLAAEAAAMLRHDGRVLTYAYHGDLDLTGHLRGPATDAWTLDLANVDRLAAAIAERLPSDAALVVTADHGMVEVTERIDVDAAPDLLDGVRLVGGEPRARHVYARAGAAADVLAVWQASLGDGFAVVPREEAIASGWFGPTVSAMAHQLIGDVVAAARGSGGLVRRGAEPLQSSLIGHHGSLTAGEMMVPLLVGRP